MEGRDRHLLVIRQAVDEGQGKGSAFGAAGAPPMSHVMLEARQKIGRDPGAAIETFGRNIGHDRCERLEAFGRKQDEHGAAVDIAER